MTFEIALVLVILMSSVVFFIWEKFSPDVVAMMVLITLAITGLVSAADVFSGFANPAVVTVWAVYIISEGLFKTGIADFLGAQILKLSGSGEKRLLSVIMLTVGGMSAFMNNVGATAILLPAVVNLCKKIKLSPSKLLIPAGLCFINGRESDLNRNATQYFGLQYIARIPRYRTLSVF